MSVENTSKRDPAIHLLGAMSDGTSGYITGIEAAGQRQLVHSDLLPTELLYCEQADFEALGFTFGDVVEDDPLFRHASLPEGWKRSSSDHDMWSYIEDERGIERVAVFYKAAFYDRKAHVNLTNVGRNVASKAIYGDDPIPWEKLTDDERADAVVEAESYLEEAERHPDIYGDRVPKAQAVLDEAARR